MANDRPLPHPRGQKSAPNGLFGGGALVSQDFYRKELKAGEIHFLTGLETGKPRGFCKIGSSWSSEGESFHPVS